MSVDVPLLHWTSEEFVDAWDSGAFEGRHRVQLVEGEVWELGPIGSWHGQTVPRLAWLLRRGETIATSQTLPIGDASLPDPDLWILRSAAPSTGSVRRFPTWDPTDVLLVVEVADTTRVADLNVKARLYAGGGIAHYWVVTPDALHVFTGPTDSGYTTSVVLRSGDTVQLPYGDDGVVAVTDLLG